MTQSSIQFGILALASASLFMDSASAEGGEWDRFRGPNGSGVGNVKGLPAHFTMGDYEWLIDLGGTGHSSPVVWGNLLYLTVEGKDGQHRRVIAVDTAKGRIAWNEKEKFSSHHKHDFNNFASSTPAVDDGGVYVAWSSGESTYALSYDHEGKRRWSREWQEFSSDHGSAASPILVDGKLILHTDSKEKRQSLILALDVKTGETVWEKVRQTPKEDKEHLTSYSTPTTVTVDGKTMVVFLSTNHGWLGLDPETGDTLMTYDDPSYDKRSVGSLTSADGMVFATLGAGTGGKYGTALKIIPGKMEPEVLYSLKSSDDLSYVPTPLIHDGLLYMVKDNGVMSCRNATTGEAVYAARIEQGQFFSSPVLADGKIFAGSRDGRMFAIKAGPKYVELGRSEVGGELQSTPALANNRMYIRTDSHLICLPRR